MMCTDAEKLIPLVWLSVHATPFDVQKLSIDVINYCGVDNANLTPSEIESLFLGTLTERWGDIAFAFDEALAVAASTPIDGSEFVVAVFMSLYLAEAIRRGHGDWELSFDKICILICNSMHRIDVVLRMALLRDVLK
jgi:hypothetical protein